MSIFIDSSIFLRLFLDEPGAKEAQDILELVEENRVVDITTPMVLEEVTFKLMYAKASECSIPGICGELGRLYVMMKRLG